MQQAESEEVNRLKGIIKKLQAGIAVDNIDEAVASADAAAEEAAQAALAADRKRRAAEDQVAFGDDVPPDGDGDA